jgi:hypothetical protein
LWNKKIRYLNRSDSGITGRDSVSEFTAIQNSVRQTAKYMARTIRAKTVAALGILPYNGPKLVV